MVIYSVYRDCDIIFMTRSESKVIKYWEDHNDKLTWVVESVLDTLPHKEWTYSSLEEFVEAH